MDPGNEVRWKLYAEAVRTWLPLVISACAISLTIYQAYNTRRHTRLSVQPRLDWTIDVTPDGGIAYSLRQQRLRAGDPAIAEPQARRRGGRPRRAGDLRRDRPAARPRGRRLGHRLLRHGGRLRDPSPATASSSTRAGRPRRRRPARSRVGPEEYLRLTPEGRYCSFYEDCWTLD